jgi:phospholipid/cholesterol/gamma-HCH transport system substrate-binding protein
VDGARVNRILARLDHITATLDQHLDPLLTDTRGVLSDGRTLTHFLAADEQLRTYRELSGQTLEILRLGKQTATDVRDIAGHVKAGRGTVGQLIMDEALFDDLQELVRDLKHNPWKIMWKN